MFFYCRPGKNTTAKKDSLVLLCFIYLGFGERKRRSRGFIDGCFCKNFQARSYSRVTAKTKSVSNLSHLLAFRSCISDEFELLHFSVAFLTRSINLRLCMASFLKYTEAFSKQFSDCKWKRRSSKENLVVVLMLVVQRRRLLIISG